MAVEILGERLGAVLIRGVYMETVAKGVPLGGWKGSA